MTCRLRLQMSRLAPALPPPHPIQLTNLARIDRVYAGPDGACLFDVSPLEEVCARACACLHACVQPLARSWGVQAVSLDSAPAVEPTAAVQARAADTHVPPHPRSRLRASLIKRRGEILAIPQKSATSLNKRDCGIFGRDSPRFVAVIDAAFQGLRPESDDTSQKIHRPDNSDAEIFGTCVEFL